MSLLNRFNDAIDYKSDSEINGLFETTKNQLPQHLYGMHFSIFSFFESLKEMKPEIVNDDDTIAEVQAKHMVKVKQRIDEFLMVRKLDHKCPEEVLKRISDFL